MYYFHLDSFRAQYVCAYIDHIIDPEHTTNRLVADRLHLNHMTEGIVIFALTLISLLF